MSLSRRKMLALVGGGTVLAASASAALFVTTRTPTRALVPWETAGSYSDPRLRALSYALLAPNAHNMQPWQAELVESDRVRIHRDPSRLLSATDPYSRQLTVSMGCFLELMMMAAGQDGLATDLTLFPRGEADGEPVAEAVFRSGGTPDPLFSHVFDRRSCKEPFDMGRPVTDGMLGKLAPAGRTDVRYAATADAGKVEAIRKMTWNAWEIEAASDAAWGESVDLLRIGRAEIEANPDGIDLGSPLLEVLRRAGMITRDGLMDRESSGFRSTRDRYLAMFENTPAFAWLATSGNTRRDQIAAGRSWLRLNLAVTGAGLAIHPVSQALQEYPEMAEPYAQIHGMLADEGETVQMLGRVGFGPQTPRTPRWPLEARLIDG